LNKDWQKKFEDWLNFQIPYRPELIRSHNQIYYSLFSKSYMNDSRIIVGKKKYLYEIGYITRYCNSDHKIYTQQQFNEWVSKLQALNDFFQKRGQKFIYIFSPSKAGYFPEYFPTLYQCTGSHRPDYYMAQHVLKTAAFPYINATQVLSQNKSKYGDLLFPRGGIHWTLLGAALIIPDILKKIGSTDLPRLQLSYTTDFKPQGTDKDLLDLLNILSTQNYIVPTVSFVKSPVKHLKKRLKVALIGGSFLGQIIQLFSQEKLFAQMDYYVYLTWRHMYMADGTIPLNTTFGLQEDVDLNNPKTYQDILNADVVIFEENEDSFQNPNSHLDKLLNTLKLNSQTSK
jgi:hypothetical protein